MTRRVPQLHRAMPGAYVELHPEDAARLGIRTGDRVRLRSRRGEIVLPAWVGVAAHRRAARCLCRFLRRNR